MELLSKTGMFRVLDFVIGVLALGTTSSRFEARIRETVAFELDDFFGLLFLLAYFAMWGVLKWGES